MDKKVKRFIGFFQKFLSLSEREREIVIVAVSLETYS